MLFRSMIGLLGQPELTNGAGGLFMGGGLDMFINQAIGSGATVIWVAVTSVVMFGALKAINRLRVNPQADLVGIDVFEHGATAYPDILAMPEDMEMGGSAATAPATGD